MARSTLSPSTVISSGRNTISFWLKPGLTFHTSVYWAARTQAACKSRGILETETRLVKHTIFAYVHFVVFLEIAPWHAKPFQ